MDGTPPLYRRSKPTSLISFLHDGQTPIASIDLTNIHLPPYGEFNTVAEAVRLLMLVPEQQSRPLLTPCAKITSKNSWN
jgi:hypothetical protein